MRLLVILGIYITILGCGTGQYDPDKMEAALAGWNDQIQAQQAERKAARESQKSVDYQCMQDCQTRYQYSFCQSKCKY